MKNRYNKFVFEGEKGITFNAIAEEGKVFELSEGKNGEIIIRALNITKNSENYANPPVPDGYKHVCGEWDNGFVIQRASDESEFVWIPVGHLAANGTLDGRHFTEKLGRRKYKQDDVFSDDMYHEDMNQELIEQVESVKKYGGFYISRYNISRSLEGEPQSIKGAIPWVEISFGEAKKKAATIESSETVTSHLTYGAEYDSVLQWFIQSRERHLEEIVMNSANWGNYSNTNLSPEKLLETGSNKEWCTNGIYDFAGNVDEWTQEKYNNSFCVIRGGRYRARGDCRPVAVRARCGSGYYTSGTGFRAVLCIK